MVTVLPISAIVASSHGLIIPSCLGLIPPRAQVSHLPQCINQTSSMRLHLQKEEEAQMPAAEGSQARGGPATPKEAPARRAPSQGAPSLAPQVQVVNGRIVVVQNSLTVQAQAEDFQRRVTVEDNPVRVSHVH